MLKTNRNPADYGVDLARDELTCSGVADGVIVVLH